MDGPWPASALLLFLLASTPVLGQADVQGWAVVVEMDDYPDAYQDLPVGYINSQRVTSLLLGFGWNGTHIQALQGNVTSGNLSQALDWLDGNSDEDDLVLLYVSMHGSWLSRVILWDKWVPQRWRAIGSQRKLLIIDTCNSGHFIAPFANESAGQVSMAGCSEGELEWAGLEEENLPIIGSVWEYFLTYAFSLQSADVDQDGWVSVEEAFNSSVTLTQAYMRETVFAVSEFVEMYRQAGVDPDRVGPYPNPVILDCLPGPFVLDLKFYVPEGLCIVCGIMGCLWAVRRRGSLCRVPRSAASLAGSRDSKEARRIPVGDLPFVLQRYANVREQGDDG